MKLGYDNGHQFLATDGVPAATGLVGKNSSTWSARE
jgi:hypothetical protein